jgi:hypothetical protein
MIVPIKVLVSKMVQTQTYLSNLFIHTGLYLLTESVSNIDTGKDHWQNPIKKMHMVLNIIKAPLSLHHKAI